MNSFYMYLFLMKCLEVYRFGSEALACVYWGCMISKSFLKVWARCWCSGWNFIVFGRKYVLSRLLCAPECVCKRLGIRPVLGSMSSQFSRKRSLGTKYHFDMVSCGF